VFTLYEFETEPPELRTVFVLVPRAKKTKTTNKTINIAPKRTSTTLLSSITKPGTKAIYSLLACKLYKNL
jgi:hypothetical protein